MQALFGLILHTKVMAARWIGCDDDGRQMELVEGRVQWQDFVLAELELRIHTLLCYLIIIIIIGM
jgi:hypothetical protein